MFENQNFSNYSYSCEQTLEHGKNRVLCVCACVTHTHEHDTQKHEIFVCAHEITHEKHEIFVCAHEITQEKHEIFVCAREITHEKHEIFRVRTQFHTRNTKISCMRFFKKMSEHLKK